MLCPRTANRRLIVSELTSAAELPQANLFFSPITQAQLEAQRRETRGARETLAEAEAEMETIHFETKQLTA